MRQTETTGIDIRDLLFEHIRERSYAAQIRARADGVLSGSAMLRERGDELGVVCLALLPEGAPLRTDTVVAEFAGRPKQLALCEESLIGIVAKYSGVATAAACALQAAGRLRVVCGAWKKMPGELKQPLRRAITTGGMPTRLVDRNFLYLDKNYVRMLGGISSTLLEAQRLGQRVAAIQLRGETSPIGEEAMSAANAGADILMVDTGRIDDVRTVSAVLGAQGMRDRVQIAYSGGLVIADLAGLQSEDIDIIDIGRAVIDAPLLDMSMDIVGPYHDGEQKNGKTRTWR